MTFVRSFVRLVHYHRITAPHLESRAIDGVAAVVSVTKSGGTNTQQFARSFVSLVVCLVGWLLHFARSH